MDLKFSAEAGDGRQQVKGGWQKKDVVKVLPVSLSLLLAIQLSTMDKKRKAYSEII